MDRRLKEPPPYAIRSVDNALRLAAILQLEGEMSVSEVAVRLGVARSTAHRLLSMLVFRDFAIQTERRNYSAGPVLALAASSQTATARLRALALPLMVDLVDQVNESANLIIRTGDTARFIASVECSRALRVGNREGMAFPAHRVTGGLVLLAELRREELEALYAAVRYEHRPDQRPDMPRLRRELRRISASGFALNQGLSERGVVALGRPVRVEDGQAIAGLSISMPSVRYDAHRLSDWVQTLGATIKALESALTTELVV